MLIALIFSHAYDNNTSFELELGLRGSMWLVLNYLFIIRLRPILLILVSFGGIAGLFLGFSLLSGVELVYYFTLRAWCAAVRDRDMLRRERAERLAQPKPAYDLSLVPWCVSNV